MNIIITDIETLIIFKSEPRFYELESSGKKSNTIRTLNRSEYNEMLIHPPTHIRIFLKGAPKRDVFFTRKITDVMYVGSNAIADTYTMLFSWG